MGGVASTPPAPHLVRPGVNTASLNNEDDLKLSAGSLTAVN